MTGVLCGYKSEIYYIWAVNLDAQVGNTFQAQIHDGEQAKGI